jgi:alpha-tubulin suppressor-like RCC1 family protein
VRAAHLRAQRGGAWLENVQLGDGSTTDRSAPVAVSGLSSGSAAVAAGAYHSCALNAYGRARCWGFNYSGQLGDATTTDSPVPVWVSGTSLGVTVIAPGGYHTCQLNGIGNARCWGANGSGQLGDGTTTDSSVPVDVSGLSSGGAVIAAGGFHGCAVIPGGGIECWGNNFYGQLGNGTSNGSSVPVSVIDFPGEEPPPAAPALGTPALGLLVAALGLAGAWSRPRSGGPGGPDEGLIF